ncbi:hypothetical protein LCGC14_3121350, partial [marine sediment metagenome]
MKKIPDFHLTMLFYVIELIIEGPKTVAY